mmetsp:Transcript_32731/g.87870  ORF Transcript_32731/g.87870 Transcript_32731/m.87870 type:complete len:82 (-) Transcript_32731:25-270(-)
MLQRQNGSLLTDRRELPGTYGTPASRDEQHRDDKGEVPHPPQIQKKTCTGDLNKYRREVQNDMQRHSKSEWPHRHGDSESG